MILSDATPNLPKSQIADSRYDVVLLVFRAEVTESISSTSERLLSKDDSVAVEGSYFVLERRRPSTFFMNAGVKDGILTDFSPNELDFLPGVSSLFGVFFIVSAA